MNLTQKQCLVVGAIAFVAACGYPPWLGDTWIGIDNHPYITESAGYNWIWEPPVRGAIPRGIVNPRIDFVRLLVELAAILVTFSVLVAVSKPKKPT